MLQYLQVNSELINEIISAKEYKGYKKNEGSGLGFKNFSVQEYKTVLPVLKNIFKDLNGGKFARTVVFDYNSIKNETKRTLSANDKLLMTILTDAGYDVSEESYRLGMAMKNNKALVIHDIVTTLRAKDLDKLEEVYKKSPNENIKKQITAVQQIYTVNYSYTIPSELSKGSNYKIVLSMESRKIASQSTKTGWTSCMNLASGMYRAKVMSGIEQGVIIAWLVKTGDEKSLTSPSARALIKPMKDAEDPNEIYWVVDKVYGTDPGQQFKEKIESIFKKYSSTKNGIFILDSNKIYADDVDAWKSNLTNESKQKCADIYENFTRGSDEYRKALNNLTKQEKIFFAMSYDYNSVDRLDYSKSENAQVYYSVCKIANSIFQVSKEKADQIIKNLNINQISQLIKINSRDFFNIFKELPQDTIYKILLNNAKTMSEKLKKELAKKLTPIYLKLLSKKMKLGRIIGAGTSIEEFNKSIADSDNFNTEVFEKFMKDNAETYRFPKMLINAMAEQAIRDNDKAVAYQIMQNIEDKYIKTLTQDNAYNLMKMLTKAESYISKDLIYKLGATRITDLIVNGNLSTYDTLKKVTTYSDSIENFYLKLIAAADSTDSKEIIYRILSIQPDENFALYGEQFFRELFKKIAKLDTKETNNIHDIYTYAADALLKWSKIEPQAKEDIIKPILQKVKKQIGEDNLNKLLRMAGLKTKIFGKRQIAEHYLRIVRGE